MNHLILTVSRQFGSGGHTISRMVAEKLGIPCYDKELLEQITRESGFFRATSGRRGRTSGPRASWPFTARGTSPPGSG